MLMQMFELTVQFVDKAGYIGVLIMMTLESTFVPIPSELVMPQVGYLVAQGNMNFWVGLLMCTSGGVLGALINYGIAVTMGRPLMLKYGKFFLCPPHKFEKMEKFFNAHGEISTFTGRLILGVRHFISFPAGLSRMHIWKFCFYTAFGAGLWGAILETIGFLVGDKPELIKKYAHQAAAGAALACIAIVVVYVIVHKRRKAAALTQPPAN